MKIKNYLEKINKCVEVFCFKCIFTILHPANTCDIQHDSQELLRFLLDDIKNKLKKVKTSFNYIILCNDNNKIIRY